MYPLALADRMSQRAAAALSIIVWRLNCGIAAVVDYRTVLAYATLVASSVSTGWRVPTAALPPLSKPSRCQRFLLDGMSALLLRHNIIVVFAET